jgi:hypothetical protein
MASLDTGQNLVWVSLLPLQTVLIQQDTILFQSMLSRYRTERRKKMLLPLQIY